MFGFAELVELLVAGGAQIDARNDWGWTPLHVAVNQKQAAAAEALLRARPSTERAFARGFLAALFTTADGEGPPAQRAIRLTLVPRPGR